MGVGWIDASVAVVTLTPRAPALMVKSLGIFGCLKMMKEPLKEPIWQPAATTPNAIASSEPKKSWRIPTPG